MDRLLVAVAASIPLFLSTSCTMSTASLDTVVYNPGYSNDYVYSVGYYNNRPYWGNNYYSYGWATNGYWGGGYYNGY